MVLNNITTALTIPIDIGKDVAGMPESPLRHSVDHWYGGIPRRGMAGAGPAMSVGLSNKGRGTHFILGG